MTTFFTMIENRLTNDRTYYEVKENAEKLISKGFTPSVLELMYIKLAEYERNEYELQKKLDVIFAENTELRLQIRRLSDAVNARRQIITNTNKIKGDESK